jgi:hypothetical protein
MITATILDSYQLERHTRTFCDNSAEPVRIFNSTSRPTRFGVFTLQRATSYMMSRTNDTTRLSVASDISTDKFEMGRSDWSSVCRPTELGGGCQPGRHPGAHKPNEGVP